jgi:hypothetical protein
MAAKKRTPRRKKTADNGKGWPVHLAKCESAIRKQDKYVFRRVPRFVDEVVEATAAHVKKNRQTCALDFLCEQGCPQRELLYLLGMCENRGVTNAVKMTGFDPAELRKKLRDLRACADAIWKLNGHAEPQGLGGTEFGQLLEMAEVKRSTLANFLQLPIYLREYASLVDHAFKYLGGKSDFYLNLAKTLLVRFVRERTNKDYNKEVAKLLSVMVGLEYGDVEHRVFRGKYEKRFMHYRPDPTDSPSLRAKKTLLECVAAILYRMHTLHTGDQHLRQEGRTVLRPTDSAYVAALRCLYRMDVLHSGQQHRRKKVRTVSRND